MPSPEHSRTPRQVGAFPFPREDGSRIPYRFFHSPAIYEQEQEKIFRGPTWSFLGLEAEIEAVGDYKSTFIGDTPVVMTRAADGTLAAWVNRCAHRGAMVCRALRGNATSHNCVYHQWSFDSKGKLLGLPFRRGQNGMAGMPKDFSLDAHSLRALRVASYRGLVFASFSAAAPPLEDYLGPVMRPYIDRIFCKPVQYLGCTRQFSRSNWKLYLENVKDPYHASLLHLFHTTFNIFRVGMKARCVDDGIDGLHSIILAMKDESHTQDTYKEQNIRAYDEGFRLQDDSILALVPEYDVVATNHIQPIFPQLVIQQIHNTLVARQLLPKGPDHFELVFHFFGYEDDSAELRSLRIKQANLVGPAGYISMEDTEVTELIQQGTFRDRDATSVIDMAKDDATQENTLITETLIRHFWQGYGKLMSLEPQEPAA